MDVSDGSLKRIHRRAVYRAPIDSLSLSQGRIYPTALNCNVLHHILIPLGTKLTACQVMGPTINTVELTISIKIGKRFIDPEVIVESSLINELLSKLKTTVAEGKSCIETVSEPVLIPGDRKACHVELGLSVSEVPDEALRTKRPLARLQSLHLGLHYIPPTDWSIDEGRQEHSPGDQFQSLLLTHPLVLPLKSSLRSVFERFIHINLLKQLPLIFNAEWRKSLEDDLMYHRVVAQSLSLISQRSRSDKMALELSKVTKGMELDKTDVRSRQRREIEIALLELQQTRSRLPNTRVREARSAESSELDLMSAEAGSESDEDAIVWSDGEEDKEDEVLSEAEFMEVEYRGQVEEDETLMEMLLDRNSSSDSLLAL